MINTISYQTFHHEEGSIAKRLIIYHSFYFNCKPRSIILIGRNEVLSNGRDLKGGEKKDQFTFGDNSKPTNNNKKVETNVQGIEKINVSPVNGR